MLKNNIPIYFCKNPSLKNVYNLNECAKHTIGEFSGRTVLWPNQVDAKTINPKNFIELKEKFGITDILFVDKIKGTNNTISLADHVNRSGQNFLRSNTPEAEFPQFPDMSKIYNDVEGFEKSIVHTIGVERFEEQQINDNNIYSELVGLIVPVAHYVGIKVSAIGSNDIKEIIKKL